MKLEQSSVRHVRYGVGTVLQCEDAIITVDFPDAGKKQFVFPDAFERFLKAENPEHAAEITEMIILKKAEEDAIRREQEELQKAIAASRVPQKATRARTARAARTTRTKVSQPKKS